MVITDRNGERTSLMNSRTTSPSSFSPTRPSSGLAILLMMTSRRLAVHCLSAVLNQRSQVLRTEHLGVHVLPSACRVNPKASVSHIP
jgi:hypothetical protein